MKNYLAILSGLFFLYCTSLSACAQTQRQKEEIQKITPQYTGVLHKQDLMYSPYTARWFQVFYNHYDPAAEKQALKKIKDHVNDFEILCFIGTWCPDSKREIPKLYKILEAAKFKMDHFTLYTVDHRKHSQDQYENNWDILRVPTIIFLKDGKEINRFVERPRESLIQDMAKIVSNQPYTNTYQP